MRECLQSNPIETVFDLDERPTEFVIYKTDNNEILEVEVKMGPYIVQQYLLNAVSKKKYSDKFFEFFQ